MSQPSFAKIMHEVRGAGVNEPFDSMIENVLAESLLGRTIKVIGNLSVAARGFEAAPASTEFQESPLLAAAGVTIGTGGEM